MVNSFPPVNPSEPAEGASVLLVDDDQVNLLLTGMALRERGFVVTEASSGAQALQMLQDWSPDVIVLDAMMPELDGFATCARLHAMPGLEYVPVLMLTGLDDDASIARAYRAGATDFFVKSTQWNLLAGRLRYMLRASRTRAELERSKAKLARAQDLARMGSFDWRPVEGMQSGRLDVSPEALRVFGMPPQQRVRLGTLVRLVRPEDRAALVRRMASSLRHQNGLATDLSLRLPDGRERIVHVDAEPEFSDHGALTGYTGVVQDVTDRRQAEDKIRHLANFDSLTGLPNRRQLIWRTERALEHARRLSHQCALLLIDLDRFKFINDTLGHAAGDEMLSEVANRLRSCVRHSDQIVEGVLESVGSRVHRGLEAVGRLGGDEFVALLPEIVDERDAERVAARMLDVLRAPIFVQGQECFVTASVGIAVFPRDGNSVVDLLRNSDVAMYSAKEAGRNASAAYSPLLAGRGREKLELESALHKALEREELVLHYQPKVDVATAQVVGVEALMRWQRGDRLVMPGDFIPLAEESGLIVPLSEWAIREATRQAAQWKRQHELLVPIAVNLPSRLFERSDLIETLHASTTAQGMPSHCLQLEITETGLMKNLQDVMPSLHRLNEIGIEISIDDFGTGYSSLAYLTTLPISELKIDRSFVRELGVSPQGSAVVSAIIALARSLNLRVIAEGVETQRQMEVLHRLGCWTMQGFLFSRAIESQAFIRWMRDIVHPRRAGWLSLATAHAPLLPTLGGAPAPTAAAPQGPSNVQPAAPSHASYATHGADVPASEQA